MFKAKEEPKPNKYMSVDRTIWQENAGEMEIINSHELLLLVSIYFIPKLHLSLSNMGLICFLKGL